MSESKAVRPEDVLPDGVDGAELNGVRVRKGSVAAFCANVQQLHALSADSPDRVTIEEQLRALAPAVRAAGVFDVFALRSPEIAAIIDVHFA